MIKKVVIFDFDGTIADTLNVGIEMYNEFAPLLNCRVLNNEDLEDLRCKRPQEFLNEYGITRLKLSFLLFFARKKLKSRINQIRPIAGIEEVLRMMSGRKEIELGVLTSNSKENVYLFLRNNNLEDLFDFVYSYRSVFGKSRVIENMLRDREYSREHVVYIGDETRDIEAARKSRVSIISVGWGFNHSSVLRTLNPDYIAEEPRELFDCLFK